MKKKHAGIILFLALCCFADCFSQVRLPRLISDGMVLQRGDSVKIWGWAAPAENVIVHFTDKMYQTTADADGKWMVLLSRLEPGGPYTMQIEASNSIVVNEILIGDVWLCSGQSNMELPVRRVRPLYENEIAASQNNYIRSFIVPKYFSFKETYKDLPSGRWVAADPVTVLDFSAAAWFFARELYKKHKIPIGLLTSAFGGSPAEAWISEEGLKEFPQYYNELQCVKSDSLIRATETADRLRMQEWYSSLQGADEGYKTPDKKWSDPDLNTDDWKTISIPGFWSGTELKEINGAVWFRKDIMIPASAAGLPGQLNLGRIVDADSVFLNGTFIGTTSYQYPPRWYNIPERILKEGRNIITIRVISNIGDGGFAPDKIYELTAGDLKVALEGQWKYKIGAVMPPLRGQTFFGYKPGGLFNAMLYPLLNYRIRGIIWYQGESNAERAVEYRDLFPALIRDWRKNFEQGDVPFLFVQLPNFMKAKDTPTNESWALFREAQTSALVLPATGMAVTYDIGEWNDIHPLYKKDVGIRLALAARKVAYGEKDIVYSGPAFRSMTVEGHKIILSFDNAGSGLMVKGGGRLKHFAIAGQDMRFVWARARIKGDSVIVWSSEVKEPVAVRYAWANNPEGANLYNREGLPAAPFRTDK
jgi:sialate O-acetylesterase